jgi:hypothetical protein
VSLAFRCDGPDCGKVLERDDHRIELADVPAVVPLTQDELDEGYLQAVVGGSFEAENHFCSHECLAAWSMSRALEVAS